MQATKQGSGWKPRGARVQAVPPRAWPSAAPAVSDEVWGRGENPQITFLGDTGPQPGEISKGASGGGGGGGGAPNSQASPLDLPQASCGLQSGGRASLIVHRRGCMVGLARSGQARSGTPSGGGFGCCVGLGGSVETAEGEAGPTGALSGLPLIWVLSHSQSGSSPPHAWAWAALGLVP